LYELSHLAQPVDAQQPCGPDCEYDAEFLALSQAAVGKPEQQFGDTVIPAVEPDWREIEQMASALLVRTKDLRVLAWLTQAATRLHGVPGFAAGVQLMNQLCEQYWDDVHPRLVIDGEHDPYLRINALASLSDSGGSYADGSPIMRALREALIANRAVTIRVRDVELTATNQANAAYTDAQILSIIGDSVQEGVEAITAFEQGASSFSALDAQIKSRMPGDERPDFAAMGLLLKSVGGVIARARAASVHEAGDAQESDGEGGSATVGSRAGIGELRSREDVRRALQRVCTYLEQHEPSSPASLFARRAERMLGMDFIGIIRELSPDSMQQIQMVTGTRPEDE
jgi:type VI secretion system protein ImpA